MSSPLDSQTQLNRHRTMSMALIERDSTVHTWTPATVHTLATCTASPVCGVMLPKVSSAAAPKMEVYSATLRATSSDIRHCVISVSASIACAGQALHWRTVPKMPHGAAAATPCAMQKVPDASIGNLAGRTVLTWLSHELACKRSNNGSEQL